MGHLFSRAFRRITQCSADQSRNQEKQSQQQQGDEREGKFSTISLILNIFTNNFIPVLLLFTQYKILICNFLSNSQFKTKVEIQIGQL